MWARYSAPVRSVTGVHAASHKMGTGSLPKAKRPGVVALITDLHPPPNLTPRLKTEYSYTSTPPSVPSWLVIGWPLPLFFSQILTVMNLQVFRLCWLCHWAVVPGVWRIVVMSSFRDKPSETKACSVVKISSVPRFFEISTITRPVTLLLIRGEKN